ncbi:hypothetical protein ACSMXN_17140 [Jatrophihabitans sp. DSM 45814]
MGAYVTMDGLPATLLFVGVSAAEFAPVVAKWMEHGKILTVGATERTQTKGFQILVNFGSAPIITIKDSPTRDDPKRIFEVHVNLDTLLEELD